MDYRVELVQEIVDPDDPSPHSPAAVGGYFMGHLSDVRIALGPGTVPSFLSSLTRREIDDPDRWIFDYGGDLQPVSGGFVAIVGHQGAQGPEFELQPPYPGNDDYEFAYPAIPFPRGTRDDVLFKTTWDSNNIIVHVPNTAGAFDLRQGRILFSEDEVIPSSQWRMDEFQSCFLGIFDNPATGGQDLVAPITFKSLVLLNEYKYTYMILPHLDLAGVDPDPVLADPLLLRSFPNPFNPRTTISFRLPQPSTVHLDIFDACGRLVRVLIDGKSLAQGRRLVTWDGRDLNAREVPAGVYFYRLETDTFGETGKMTVVR